MSRQANYTLGRRFNGLHDYLFRLYEEDKELGAFALTQQQFDSAMQGEEVIAECRFNEDESGTPTREVQYMLERTETGWTMILHLTRKTYSTALTTAQLDSFQHEYGTESVVVKTKRTRQQPAPCEGSISSID